MRRLGIQRKVDVLRAGLDLLEREVAHAEKVLRWKRAVSIVARTGIEVSTAFQQHSRLKRL